MSRQLLLRTTRAALAAAALIGGAARADLFPAQSLIIPTQSNYQDACGMVSTYGLVYSVLRANDGLRKDPSQATGVWQSPITVHWVYNASKSSPNRCVPTGAWDGTNYSNVDVVYAGASAVSGSPGLTDVTWNDGCDMRLDNKAGPPATLVNNSNTAASADTAIVTIDTTTSTGVAMSFPNFKSKKVKVDGTSSPNKDVTSLQYSGGAFVISAGDAPAFLALLQGTITTKDAEGNVVNFSAFKSNGGTGCSVGTTGSAASGTLRAVFTSATGGDNYANVHQVNIHRAQVPFNADDNQRMNASPPRIGLLQSNDHDYSDENGKSVLTGLSAGNTDPVTGLSIVGAPTGVKGTQLGFYLKSAGLDFTGAGGCPSDGYNALYTGWTGGKATYTLCDRGAGVAGMIYDNLDVVDFKNNLINALDSTGNPRYSVIWTPHWEGRPWKLPSGSQGLPTSGCDASCISAALSNLATFLNDTAHAHGLMAECASIGTLEGAINYTEPVTCANNLASCTGTGADYIAQPSYGMPGPSLASQSLTCQQGSVAGSCTSSPTSGPPVPAGVTHDAGYSSIYLPNCTNPTTAAGTKCVHFPNPGSPFAQVGDYRWFTYSGAVSDFFPIASGTGFAGSVYKAGWLPLAYHIGSLDKTVLATNPRSLAVSDNFSFIQRENDKRRAQIVYLGGHNYTPDVAGTRVVLNTVLSLGLVIDTKESAFIGPTIYGNQAAVPTYYRNISTGIPISWRVFDPSAGQAWVFPYTQGNLRIHNISNLVAGSNAYSSGSSYLYSAVMPAPDKRNLFTYLGGRVSATDSELAGSFKAANGNGVAQIGWQPVDVDAGNVGDSSAVSCLDVAGIGAVTKGSKSYPGMVSGANGVCDLQEALELTITSQDLGSDNGASSAEQTAIVNKLLQTSQVNNAQWLVQMVRGFCYATASGGGPKLNPALSDCDSKTPSNAAELGGLVHSQPAVIPASTLIADAPSGKRRPTMIYVGGLDGQLHAFYLPIAGDTNDSGYTGPANAVTVGAGTSATPTAHNVFKVKYTSFSPPSQVQELWSFIPPGQLPFLKNNSARVDSSPAVADVFGDFDGTGLRKWHTVLVASAGGTNREIFALDVTNPLKPILLWDIQSTYDSTQLPYAPASLQDDDTGIFVSGVSGSARAQSFNWQNRCTAASTTAGTCRPANYVLPPTNDNCDTSTPPICGRTTSSLYNYSHLGASQSVSVGTLRRNNAPVFAAFVGTNEPGGHGIYVFAIDLVNGAKLWEWNNPYDRESYKTSDPDKYAGAGNTPPAGVSIVSRSLDDQINSLYVGDDEGSLWEIDAADGVNNTGYGVALGCTPGSCNFPLSQAYGDGTNSAQPISTLATLFVVRPDIPVAGLFKNYIGQTVLAYGTGGTDAAASISPPTSPSTVSVLSGAVHMLPVSPALRDTATDILGEAPGTTKKTHAATWGVGYELGKNKDGTGTAFFPQRLSGGNRIYGSIAADLVTGRLFFGTTLGSVTDINARGALSGSLYQIDTTVSSSTSPISSIASTGGIGGTLGMAYDSSGKVTLIASTDKDLFVKQPTSGGLTASANKVVYKLDGTDVGGGGASAGAQGLIGWILRRSGREY